MSTNNQNELWCEKYRPNGIKNIILNENNDIILNSLLTSEMNKTLIFYGCSGTGKTTTVHNFIKSYQLQHIGVQNNQHILSLNASDESNIDTIRNKIQCFCKTNNIFMKGKKFIILDEVDYMSKTSQSVLANIIEQQYYKPNNNISFILICNYISKINRNIQNISIILRFDSMKKTEIYDYIVDILKQENIKITQNSTEQIYTVIHKYYPDIRLILNTLQNITDTTHYIENETLNEQIISNIQTLYDIHYFYKYINKEEYDLFHENQYINSIISKIQSLICSSNTDIINIINLIYNYMYTYVKMSNSLDIQKINILHNFVEKYNEFMNNSYIYKTSTLMYTIQLIYQTLIDII